jgi:hypothetical protein
MIENIQYFDKVTCADDLTLEAWNELSWVAASQRCWYSLSNGFEEWVFSSFLSVLSSGLSDN